MSRHTPQGPSGPTGAAPADPARRRFLRAVGGAGALGALSACGQRGASQLISPAQHPEEDATPGLWVRYPTTCLECPAGCAIVARTHEGRVVSVEGNPKSPLTRGRICARGIAAVQGLYAAERLTGPLRRREDGSFEAIPWDEALRELTLALRDGKQTPEGFTCLTGEVSDAEADALDEFLARHGMSQARNLRLKPERALYRDLKLYIASALATPEIVPEPKLEEATLVVAVGADFLETWGSPVTQAVSFAEMRARTPEARAVYVGPRRSLTCAACDEWIPAPPGQEADVLWVLTGLAVERWKGGHLSVFRRNGGRQRYEAALQTLPVELSARLKGLADEYVKAERPLVLVDPSAPDAQVTTRLAVFLSLAIQARNTAALHVYNPCRRPRGDALDDITSAIATPGRYPRRLMLVRAGPAFGLPHLTEAIDRAGYVVALTTTLDESARLADLVLPLHHPLEDWGYQETDRGFVSIQQPVTSPLGDTRSLPDLLALLSHGVRESGGQFAAPFPNARQLVEAAIERFVRRGGEEAPPVVAEVLQQGFVDRLASDVVTAAGIPSANLSGTEGSPGPLGLRGLIFPHPFFGGAGDAPKPWLLEVPETSSGFAWGSWIALHPDTARDLGVEDGAALAVEAQRGRVEATALVTRGIAPSTLGLPLGPAWERAAGQGEELGCSPLHLLAAPTSPFLEVAGFSVRVSKGKGAPGGTRVNHAPAALRRALADARDRQRGASTLLAPPRPSPVAPGTPAPLTAWGMVIDLDRCTGCAACVVACYAENRVPVVGPEQTRAGRQMAWLRIVTFEQGEGLRVLPLMCQHCHDAPCERACPTGAARHTSDGLSAQVYDRCVGARACLAACPYEARRFNWREPGAGPEPALPPAPDVRVREAGIAEKCSLCLQRARAAARTARREQRRLQALEVQTACALACPSGAIVFGNLADPRTAAAEAARDPRAGQLLGQLGTDPAVWYLARRERPAPAPDHEGEA